MSRPPASITAWELLVLTFTFALAGAVSWGVGKLLDRAYMAYKEKKPAPGGAAPSPELAARIIELQDGSSIGNIRPRGSRGIAR